LNAELKLIENFAFEKQISFVLIVLSENISQTKKFGADLAVVCDELLMANRILWL
jgi:hypothetical protein